MNNGLLLVLLCDVFVLAWEKNLQPKCCGLERLRIRVDSSNESAVLDSSGLAGHLRLDRFRSFTTSPLLVPTLILILLSASLWSAVSFSCSLFLIHLIPFFRVLFLLHFIHLFILHFLPCSSSSSLSSSSSPPPPHSCSFPNNTKIIPVLLENHEPNAEQEDMADGNRKKIHHRVKQVGLLQVLLVWF